MIQFRVERGWSFDGYQAWILEYRNGKSYVVKPMEMIFKELPDGNLLPEPSIKISGPLAMTIIPELKKALAGFDWLNKDEYDQSKRVEKAMQEHINSLKVVVDRIVK